MNKFLHIWDGHYVNVNFIIGIYVKDLGNAFDFPFKIQIIISKQKNEWTYAEFPTLQKAEKELENLIGKIHKLQK